MTVPDYLNKPSLNGHKYGTLTFEKGYFILQGEPVILEFAKRIFPGAARAGRGMVMFRPHRREVSDLNWLLMRFPVDVQCDELAVEREKVISYNEKRRAGDDLKPMVPPSEFLGKLYPYQQTAVSFLSINKRSLLGDGMGLGKTWSALGAAAAVGEYPVLVVCQTHVQRQWQRVIGALFDLPCSEQFGLYDMPFDVACRRGEQLAPILRSQKPYTIPNTPFSIIHYGLLGWWGEKLRERRYPVVIFDEVQELRHTGTQKYSQASLISSDAEYVWGLSGTPVYGYGIEIWSVTNAIEFHYLGSEDVFTREWCTGYGEKIVSNPKALNGQLTREGFLLRRKADEVAGDLPKVVRNVRDIAHDSKLYDSLIEAARDKANYYNTVSFTEKGKLARDIERDTRKAAGVSKASYVADFVAALIESGERPLVYAWHHAVHDILQEKLGAYGPSVITGRETEKKKNDNLQRYIDGKTDLVILSLRSASGLDGLQHRATCCVFAELDWSPEQRSYNMNATLKLTSPMMHGPPVVRLQEFIETLGYDCGPIDGIFGPDTQRAVKAIQCYFGLLDDGICGPVTWRVILDGANLRIVDIRGKHPRPRLYKCGRPWDTITGITLHQTGCEMPRNPQGWERLNAHIGITQEGVAVLVNNFTDWIWHAQGLSRKTIGIEIEGNYCGISGDMRTLWDGGGGPHNLNDAMLSALNGVMEFIMAEFKRNNAKWTTINAHRQATRSRIADPGEEIWKAVALPLKKKLGLSDGGPCCFVGEGRPIPSEWDPEKTNKYY